MLIGAIFCLGALACALAAEERLRLQPLIEEALRTHPEIVAAQKRYEAARQRPSQESSLPEPILSLGYASIGNPLPGAGLGREPMARAGLMFSQEFPSPGKRKLRSDMALREAQAALEDYQQVQLSVAARVKQAYHRLHHACEMIDLLERNRELLRKFLRVTEARYAAGRAAQQDILKAQTQLSILETRIEKMFQDRRARQAELNILLARPHEAPLGRPADIPEGDLAATLEDLYAAARENSPLLRRDEKMIQRTELALNLARKDYYPDYAVSAGYFNMGGMPPMFEVRLDFKLPAYSWRKQRAGVAEQAHRLGEARRNLEATELALRFRIQDDYLMAQTARRLMRMYAATVVPQAALAVESSLAAYQTGGGDFLTLLSNFMTVIEYETNYHEEMLSFHLALVRLEEMTAMKLIDD